MAACAVFLGRKQLAGYRIAFLREKNWSGKTLIEYAVQEPRVATVARAGQDHELRFATITQPWAIRVVTLIEGTRELVLRKVERKIDKDKESSASAAVSAATAKAAHANRIAELNDLK